MGLECVRGNAGRGLSELIEQICGTTSVALRQVCLRFRVVTHPGSVLGCGCEIIQHQGVVPVRRVRRGEVSRREGRGASRDAS